MVCTDSNYISYCRLLPPTKSGGKGAQMNNNNARLLTVKCKSCCVAEEYNGLIIVNTCLINNLF